MIKLIALGVVIIAVTSFVGVTVFNYSQQKPTAPPPALTLPDKQQVFDLVNQERVKAGEAVLVDDARLDASAAAKCADMDTYNYKAHVSPQGVSWQSFFYPELQKSHIGENLVENAYTAQQAINSWMGSPEHKANILDGSYNHVGYAVCGKSTNDLFDNAVVQHFAQE
jgi:uncharacterized protein YkwD